MRVGEDEATNDDHKALIAKKQHLSNLVMTFFRKHQ